MFRPQFGEVSDHLYVRRSVSEVTSSWPANAGHIGSVFLSLFPWDFPWLSCFQIVYIEYIVSNIFSLSSFRFHFFFKWCSARAEPKDVIACMQSRGVEVPKEAQITSWWSTYHQKRKRRLFKGAVSIPSCKPAYSTPSFVPVRQSISVPNGSSVPV